MSILRNRKGIARCLKSQLVLLAALSVLTPQSEPTAEARALTPQPAATEPSKEGQLVLNSLWASSHGEAAARPVVQGEPKAPPAPTLNSMVTGAKNRFLEEAKARVEKVVSETKDGLNSAAQSAGAGNKKQGFLANLEKVKAVAQKKNEATGLLAKARQELTDTQAWNDFAKKLYDGWKQDQINYLQNLLQYKAGLVTESLADRFKLKKKMQQSTVVSKPDEIFVIPGSMDIPVRDQAARGTCASFTGTRVIEILMQQNKAHQDLSEQYFYWSSKPKCQTSKCKGSGSWFFNGFEYSMKAAAPNIPLESDCPYNPKNDDENDTQIPLKSECGKGAIKVKRFTILKDTHDEVIAALKRGLPVAGAFYLSENFFENKGMVTLADARKSSREHSGGHAIVLNGYMGLPESQWATEGRVCFLMTNSWGKGWGVGGHACLTERWMQEHAISHFTVVEELEST